MLLAKVGEADALQGLSLDLHELTVLQQGFADMAAKTAVNPSLARPQTVVVAN